MIGRFRSYRRRRVLPFTAVWCLVFINGAALQPFSLAPELLECMAASSAGTGAGVLVGGTLWRLQYERDTRGDRDEPASVRVVGPPPIVKNLRRPVPQRIANAATCGGQRHLAKNTGPTIGRNERAAAANAADLSRLCRRLI